MCGFTLHDARALVHNRELGIPNLIYRFSDAGNRGDHFWQSFRQHAFCLCMSAYFLLAPGFGGSSIRLIDVAQGLKEGKSCIGLTLAETLLGLDAFHCRETTKFAGSPLLLQVWLMDKLKVVDPCRAYSARSYFFCPRLVDFLNERWWCHWMCSKSTVDIARCCPWFDLPEMSYSMSRQPGIQLVGLTHYVFYFPFRFRPQFSHDQTCSEEGIEYQASFLIRGPQLARYSTAWRTRELLAPAPIFSCALSSECIAWFEEEA